MQETSNEPMQTNGNHSGQRDGSQGSTRKRAVSYGSIIIAILIVSFFAYRYFQQKSGNEGGGRPLPVMGSEDSLATGEADRREDSSAFFNPDNPSERILSPDTVKSVPEKEGKEQVKTGKDTAIREKGISKRDTKAPGGLAGRHNLTLQWISWDQPGSIVFTSVGDDRYTVEGFQDGRKSQGECTECHLRIKGVVTRIDPSTLSFTGTMEQVVSYLNGGKPCIRNGTFLFKATSGRRYWRCQQMKQCDGTDYIDIYF